MKKILVAILALVLALSMLCVASAETAGITGTWYGDMYGMVATLTINEDGTYSLEIMGDAAPGEWVLEGDQLYMDKGLETEAVFTYDAAAQTLDWDGMVFGREAIEQWAPAAARADAAIEEFAGEWVAERVDAFGAVLPVADAGIEAKLSIEGAHVVLTMFFMEEEVEEGDAAFADGALTLTQEHNGETLTYVVSALEDGMLSCTAPMFGETVTFYLAKVV